MQVWFFALVLLICYCSRADGTLNFKWNWWYKKKKSLWVNLCVNVPATISVLKALAVTHFQQFKHQFLHNPHSGTLKSPPSKGQRQRSNRIQALLLETCEASGDGGVVGANGRQPPLPTLCEHSQPDNDCDSIDPTLELDRHTYALFAHKLCRSWLISHQGETLSRIRWSSHFPPLWKRRVLCNATLYSK